MPRRAKRFAMLCALVGTGHVWLTAQAPAADDKKPAAPPIVVPIEHLKAEATISVSGDRRLAVAEDSVWVSNRTAGTLIRVDNKTNAVTQTIAIGDEPCAGIAGGLGAIWVALCKPSSVARIDPKANTVTTHVKTTVAGSRRSLATGNASLWVLSESKGIVARVDPATNEPVAEVYLRPGANALAFGQGALWVTNGDKNAVTRLNPFTNVEVETITVGKNPVSVAVGEGGVWVLNGDATVSRIDTQTNKVAATIKLTVRAPLSADADIAAGEGSVWVSAPAAASATATPATPLAGSPLIRIDPRTNTVAQIFTGTGGGPILTGLSSLWLAATPTAIWRIDPKRVEATR